MSGRLASRHYGAVDGHAVMDAVVPGTPISSLGRATLDAHGICTRALMGWPVHDAPVVAAHDYPKRQPEQRQRCRPCEPTPRHGRRTAAVGTESGGGRRVLAMVHPIHADGCWRGRCSTDRAAATGDRHPRTTVRRRCPGARVASTWRQSKQSGKCEVPRCPPLEGTSLSAGDDTVLWAVTSTLSQLLIENCFPHCRQDDDGVRTKVFSAAPSTASAVHGHVVVRPSPQRPA